jgi:uncharacterized membrane protein YeaQ/YmgE (transglycosylase-associated protein family)
MTIEGIFSAVVVGATIGALGRLAVPGKRNISVWLTILIGVVAALLGALIVGPLRDTRGIDWVEILVQAVIAAIGVWLATEFMASRALR